MKRSAASFVLLLWVAACGGKSTPPPVKPPEPVVVPEPPPPPPVCIPASETAEIETATADAKAAQFCVADGGADACFTVDLATGKYDKLEEAPAAQRPALETGSARVETTPTEVRVCIDVADGEAQCTTLKPKVAKGASEPIVAAVNPGGTTVVAVVGDASRGKAVAEVWDVAKKKKVATIKYAKGDYKCGQVDMLGDTAFVRGAMCDGTGARGGLYNGKGKKLGDVGGADFGTYRTVPVQVDAARWAFLEESGGTIAVHDTATGAAGTTVDLVALWAGNGAEDAPRANGNPGTSALVRGEDGKAVVITGGPMPGNVGIVDLDTGEVKVWKALVCKGEPTADVAPGASPPEDAEPEPTVVEE